MAVIWLASKIQYCLGTSTHTIPVINTVHTLAAEYEVSASRTVSVHTGNPNCTSQVM